MEKYFLLSRGPLQIPCTLSTPDYGPVSRVVLGVHGLGGSSEDAIQAGIAEEMALFSSATLRFDFPAHGKNPMSSFTLEYCRDSLLAVAGYAKQQFPQAQDLCIFATGFGAYVTLTALEALLELPGQIRLVIQTPSVMMHETILKMARVSKQTLRTMDRITLNAARPIDVTYRFYRELEENIILTDHPIPMLILQGEKDAYISTEHIQQFHRINEGSKLVIIPGASHRFLEPGAWDMVLDLTRDWFEFQQVLLSDWS